MNGFSAPRKKRTLHQVKKAQRFSMRRAVSAREYIPIPTTDTHR